MLFVAFLSFFVFPWLSPLWVINVIIIIHYKLIKYCHNTRLAHLNRNLPPTTMANPACGVQTVDTAMVNEVLAKGTGNRSRSWNQDEKQWHRTTVELPPFKGGLGLTPQSASGIAAFYSATSALVGWLAERSHEWLRYGQCLEDPTTWSAAPLVDLKQTHTRLCGTTSASRLHRPSMR